MNGCLRLKGDVSCRRKGGREGERGEGERERKGREGEKGMEERKGITRRKGREEGEERFYNGELLLHVILITGN